MQEVINAAEKITGEKIKTVDASRRAGAPAVLIADASAAKAELSWTLKYPDIETIIAHAWGWENKNS